MESVGIENFFDSVETEGEGSRGYGRRGKSNKSLWTASVYPEDVLGPLISAFSTWFSPKNADLPKFLTDLLMPSSCTRFFIVPDWKAFQWLVQLPWKQFLSLLTLSECNVMGWQIIKMRSARWNQNTEGRKLCNKQLAKLINCRRSAAFVLIQTRVLDLKVSLK